jgi:hypothetical protein
MNYAKNLPRDTGGEPMQNFPAPFKAVNRITSENQVASSVITLHPDTTTLEVGAFGGQGAVIRWVPNTETAAAAGAKASVVASGAGANYDHYVPPSNYRRFVVPKETAGQPVGQAGSVNGLYNRLAVINAGTTATSILIAEY